MSGLSVGFFTLDYASAGDVVTQLDSLLADEGGNPFKGLFRFIPVDSANSILVVSPQEKYLKQAKDWIERLDLAEASGEGSHRLFVYRVKHGDAENLADILTKLVLWQRRRRRPRRRRCARVASGLDRVRRGGGDGEGPAAPGAQARRRQQHRALLRGQHRCRQHQQLVAHQVQSPRLQEDLDALKQLDLVPLQVLVEATIIEISLSGKLQYGVQWIFKGEQALRLQLTLEARSTTAQVRARALPRLQLDRVLRPDTVRAVLSALASEGLVNVLSSPSRDGAGQPDGQIQVGEQVPVATTQQQGTGRHGPAGQSIEYRDTGVQLTVKPRVTPGGLVQMEIEQEVSNVSDDGQLGV